jgi:hypothetical protein
VPTVVSAEGSILQQIVTSRAQTAHLGLRRDACRQFEAAQSKTAWAVGHRRRFAWVDGDELLASAEQYHLAGILDGQPVAICGIGSALSHAAHDDANLHARRLIDRLLDHAVHAGADVALICGTGNTASLASDGFETLPSVDLELGVAESPRHGAPMTLVRGGEERDLAAIVAMGQVRSSACRFHLVRDVDFVRHAMTRKRLMAGLGPIGARQFHFVIAEEGITAAAYLAISVAAGMWTIEECGDRDPSGARVGALLQALIAREPVETRPVIRGWLPPGFVPPQVTIASASPSNEVLWVRALSSRVPPLDVASTDLLYWRDDFF